MMSKRNDETDPEGERLLKEFKRTKGSKLPYYDADDLAYIFGASLDRMDAETAERALEKLEHDFPQNLITPVSRAEWYHYNMQYDDALKVFDKIDLRELDREIPDEYCLAAHCALMCKDEELMMSYYKRFIRLAEQADDEFLDKVTALLTDAVDYCPTDEAIIKIIKLTTKKFETLELLLLANDTLARMTRFEECIPYLERASELDPFSGEVWERLAYTYVKIENEEKARECCDYYFALEPKSMEFPMLVIKAEFQIADKQYEEAIATATRAEKSRVIMPQDRAGLKLIIARAYYWLDNYEKQMKYLNDALKYDNRNPEIWLQIAQNIWTRENDPRKALDTLRKAKQCAASPEISRAMACVEIELFNRTNDRKHIDNAVVLARECIRYDNTSAAYQLLAGKVLFFAGDYPAAQRYIERACKLDPQVDEGLWYSVIINVVNQHKIKFKRCYKQLVQQDSEAREKLLKIFPALGPFLDKL